MSQIETLQAQLSAERVAFTETLAAGGDTAPHRERIADLEGQIAVLEGNAQEERAAVSRAEAVAVEQAGAALAAQMHVVVDATAAAPGLAELTGEPLPAVPKDPAIDAFAREVALCRAALERADAELKPHQEQSEKLAALLVKKLDAIKAIKSRRLDGEEKPSDAAEMAMLQADADALQLLADDARSRVRSADTRATARAALASAEQQLEQARRQAEYRSTLERVELAEKVFLEAFGVMVRSGRAAGHSSPWSAFKANPNLIRAVTGQFVPGVSNPFFL